MSTKIEPMGEAGLLEALPHRFPFLMIDRVTGGVVGESIRAIKDVTGDEPFFAGHFPELPIMPGVLIIEAMAQAGGVLSYLTEIDLDPKPLFFLGGVSEARFRRPVVPGEQLVIDVRADKVRRGIWFYSGEASVNGQLAVQAKIRCAPGGVR